MVRLAAWVLLGELRAAGYAPSLEPPRNNPETPIGPKLVIRGPGKLPPELRERVSENLVALKLALLLDVPSALLIRLVDRCIAGTESTIRLTSPRGKVEIYTVRLKPKQVAAAVACEIGAPDWRGEVLSEVLDALKARGYEESGVSHD